MYIVTDENGRVKIASHDTRLFGSAKMDAPEGFDPMADDIGEWRVQDGTLVHDPQETAKEPTAEERITQLEEQNAFLTECLLEMSEIIYA